MLSLTLKTSLRCASFSLLAALCSSALGETVAMPFLSLDGDARAIGIGGAYTALAEDSNAMTYNPGGLGFAPREVSFMHSEQMTGTHQEHLAGSVDGFGWQADYVDLGRVQQTTLANPDGAGLGSVSSNDAAVALGYGRALAPSLSVGGAVKYARESLAGVSASGFAADLGLLYRLSENVRFGGSIRNMGPSVRYISETSPLPLEGRVGAAWTSGGKMPLTLASDVIPGREGVRYGIGGELLMGGLVPLRVGYDSRNDVGLGLTAGVGVRLAALRFDYAVVPYGELGYGHRVSLTWRFQSTGAPGR